jgi:hypothetical protein
MRQQVRVSPAEVERRVDDVMTAAIDRGLDAVARNELRELRALVVELGEAVDRNARTFVDAYADLFARVPDLEEAA